MQQKAIFSKSWGGPEKDRFFFCFLVFYFILLFFFKVFLVSGFLLSSPLLLFLYRGPPTVSSFSSSSPSSSPRSLGPLLLLLLLLLLGPPSPSGSANAHQHAASSSSSMVPGEMSPQLAFSQGSSPRGSPALQRGQPELYRLRMYPQIHAQHPGALPHCVHRMAWCLPSSWQRTQRQVTGEPGIRSPQAGGTQRRCPGVQDGGGVEEYAPSPSKGSAYSYSKNTSSSSSSSSEE